MNCGLATICRRSEGITWSGLARKPGFKLSDEDSDGLLVEQSYTTEFNPKSGKEVAKQPMKCRRNFAL
jgi:hypothetical protein